jgi:hypothetical protein
MQLLAGLGSLKSDAQPSIVALPVEFIADDWLERQRVGNTRIAGERSKPGDSGVANRPGNRTLPSRSSSDPDKTMAIYWLAQLDSDSHQPCNAKCLYADASQNRT